MSGALAQRAEREELDRVVGVRLDLFLELLGEDVLDVLRRRFLDGIAPGVGTGTRGRAERDGSRGESRENPGSAVCHSSFLPVGYVSRAWRGERGRAGFALDAATDAAADLAEDAILGAPARSPRVSGHDPPALLPGPASFIAVIVRRPSDAALTEFNPLWIDAPQCPSACEAPRLTIGSLCQSKLPWPSRCLTTATSKICLFQARGPEFEDQAGVARDLSAKRCRERLNRLYDRRPDPRLPRRHRAVAPRPAWGRLRAGRA